MSAQVIILLCYAAGSLCFLAGSLIALWQIIKG